MALITGRNMAVSERLLIVSGTVSKRLLIPPTRVLAVTRSGRSTTQEEGGKPEAEVTLPPGRLEDPSSEAPKTFVDEAGNEWPMADWVRHSKGKSTVPVEQEGVTHEPSTPGPVNGEGGCPVLPCATDVQAEEPVDVAVGLPVDAQVPTPDVAQSSSSTHDAQQREWYQEYDCSLQWGDVWKATQVPGGVWPEGIRIHQGRMISEGRICVPESRVQEVLREHHEFMGHAGVHKVVKEVYRRYALPVSVRVHEAVRAVQRGCAVCQACDPPNWSLKLPVSHTPVPGHVMTSVALDVFSLPATKWQGQGYDSLLVCVDRLSGWIVARPCQKVGLTAEKAAHMIMENGWETYGVPSTITSDQGSQFMGNGGRLCLLGLVSDKPTARLIGHRPMGERRWLVSP